MESTSRHPRVCLNLASAQLFVGDARVPLTPKLLTVVRYFAENPGRLLTKQELLDEIWPDTHVTEGLVKDYVRRVRRALNDNAERPHFIETARGLGYRLVGDIHVVHESGMPDVTASRWPLPVIAVLPFADLSENADQEYFATGIAEDIMADLARFRSLIVIARDSSFLYEADRPDIGKLARELDVGYIVTGTVRRAGNRLRITARLVESGGGRCIWADQYNRQLTDIFAIQDDVAQAVASRLVGHIEEFDRQRAARKRPENLDIYELLLIGNWHLREATQSDVAKAREMFQRAIALDPANARAHAEMAFSYLAEFWSDWTPAPKKAADTALKIARKATALDDRDARAHLYLATAYYYAAKNYDAARLEFDRALQLNPNDYDVFCLRSWLLALEGRPKESIACAEHAIRLSPLTTEDCRVAQCCASYGARRYKDALAALRSIPHASNHVNALRAMCCAQLSHHAEAKKAMKDFLAVASEEIIDHPEHHRQGWREYWVTRYPFKHSDDLEHMLEGLSKAGMPSKAHSDRS